MGAPWFLVGLGLLIVIGLGSLVLRSRKQGGRWRGLSFYTDLIALIVTSLLVGILALTTLTSPPAPTPTPRLQQAAVPSAFPTHRPTLPPPPTATATATDTATPAPPPTVSYTVKSGDTLSYISQLFDVSVDAIMRTNKINSPNELQVGQVLIIPVRGQLATPPAAKEGKLVHVVVSGETLSEIARKYGVSVEAILKANQMSNANTLRVGQELIIPKLTSTVVPPTTTNTPLPKAAATDTATATPQAKPTSRATQTTVATPAASPARTRTATPAPPPVATPTAGRSVVYIVQGGDTLSSIAKRYRITTDALLAANPDVDPRGLQVGQRLAIPVESGPVATETVSQPTPTAVQPSPMPQPTYAPPRPVAPADGASFGGPNQEIVLQWAWEGQLGPDEWFDVQLAEKETPFGGQTWTKETHWQLPKSLHDQSWRWRVVVVRGVQGRSREELSPPSESRRLEWH